MEEIIIFVYAKNGEIKVLDAKEAKAQDAELLKKDWKHTATLNACRYIQYLHNECKNVKKEMKSLSNHKQ